MCFIFSRTSCRIRKSRTLLNTRVPVSLPIPSKNRRYVNGFSGPTPGQVAGIQGDDAAEESANVAKDTPGFRWAPTLVKMFESSATTFASILVLGYGPLNLSDRRQPPMLIRAIDRLAGYGYHKYYKYLVLQKMERAFDPGDPVLELAALGKGLPNNVLQGDDEHWIRHVEQVKIDRIVNGTECGHYHLLIGEKGTGKSSMLLHAMQKVDGEGISMFEAHAGTTPL